MTDIARRLQEVTRVLDPKLRLWIHSMAELDRQERLAMRLAALATGLPVLAVVLLSAAGIYALMSFTVTQRRKEIGIRAALGAHPRLLLSGVFSRALAQLAIGVIVGVAIACVLDVVTGGELMGGMAAVLLPAVAALMAGVGLLATVGPAMRGLRIHPTEALRE
jgi:ABC-type lipoprotein release transport system permease subunit